MYQKSADLYERLFNSAVTLLIRCFRHLNQLIMLVWYPTRFEPENACAVYCF